MSKEKPTMVVTLDVEELAALVRREVDAALANVNPQRQDLPDPVLSAETAAKFLEMKVNVLRKRARSGEIPSFKIGALTRFRMSELNAWLAEQPRVKKAG